ncbi:MAG: DNA-binding protein [Deltaproteobacteria bacterium HGW-Deltaproteobacteria-10]|nr:MAG: DNA-binding protein [Deltaproteobacteria bacterium HGW-Deltaproteobacteria-10]
MNQVTKNWIDSANYDLQTASAMFATGRHLYVVFMCHLAIEKMFKALLSQKYPSEAPPKIHNLITLSQRVGITPPENLKDFFQRMDNVNIATRYPEDIKTITKEFDKVTSKKILTDTRKLLKWLKQNLK